MFTFDREHEKQCARQYVRSTDHWPLMDQVIDAVHDFLLGNRSKEATALFMKNAFIEGGSGVWEQTGSWFIKLANEYPYFDSIWLEIADHKSANIRFRVASFLEDMNPVIFKQLSPLLMSDSSAKVRLRASP
jgi:hypothetical protein